MVQTKTKTSKTVQEDTQEVPAEVNEQSAKVSEEACCLLGEIDSILEEAAQAEPEWDAATAPKPMWSQDFGDAYRTAMNLGDNDAMKGLRNEYHKRLNEWYAVRGLTRDRCIC
jgi:Pup-like protein